MPRRPRVVGLSPPGPDGPVELGHLGDAVGPVGLPGGVGVGDRRSVCRQQVPGIGSRRTHCHDRFTQLDPPRVLALAAPHEGLEDHVHRPGRCLLFGDGLILSTGGKAIPGPRIEGLEPLGVMLGSVAAILWCKGCFGDERPANRQTRSAPGAD